MADYDAIIIGAGAGGAVAAGILCEAGKRVLLLERGRYLTDEMIPKDHLANQRLSLYGHNAGPDEGNPRVVIGSDGSRHIVEPYQGGYQNNAATVGGGTRVYGGQAWRFHPKDFRMASEYGVPEGSSLADWPIAYEDLEPFYERAEWEIGVSGDGFGNPYQGLRKRDYPMPPVASNLQTVALKRGAEALGWETFPVPLTINTTEYHGRPPCSHCSYCVGFACEANAKNGSHNTFLVRALATGLCDLQTETMVERIDTDSQGRVTGVSYFRTIDGRTERIVAIAKVVVASGGATETPRLLLNSANALHPQGLGNEADQVGRHLQGHYYPTVWGVFEETVNEGRGPGPSIATGKFSHGNPGVIGGGMLLDDFTRLPIVHWYRALPPEVPLWGVENKRWMQKNYSRTVSLSGPVQDIPSPDGRVQVDGEVRDKYGIPVAQMSGTTHFETVRTATYVRDRAEEWMKASGAWKTWVGGIGLGLSGGQHQAGTARMGNDPETSVTDQWGRVHGHDNLYVMDASVHVTNGGYNPVLTIFALTIRNAEKLAKGM